MRLFHLSHCCFVFAMLMATVSSADDSALPKPVIPTEKIVLLNGKDLSQWYTWLQESGLDDPLEVFKLLPEGTLRISGEGFGGITTKKEYADYHLVMEYRWGTETFLSRKDRARDSGILLHCQGPDGNFGETAARKGPWMASIELQIIEGGTGDMIVLRGKDHDGKLIESTVTAEITRDRDDEPIWTAGGTPTVFTSGRVNWFGRDPDWKDVLGFRGRQDVESPGQEWTKVECYAKGDKLVYVVNGVVVNRFTNVAPRQGKILIQTEGAELYVRRVDLFPLPDVIP